jgi:hypothetical protein
MLTYDSQPEVIDRNLAGAESDSCMPGIDDGGQDVLAVVVVSVHVLSGPERKGVSLAVQRIQITGAKDCVLRVALTTRGNAASRPQGCFAALDEEMGSLHRAPRNLASAKSA